MNKHCGQASSHITLLSKTYEVLLKDKCSEELKYILDLLVAVYPSKIKDYNLCAQLLSCFNQETTSCPKAQHYGQTCCPKSNGIADLPLV